MTSRLTPGDWIARHVASTGSPENPIDLYEVGTDYARVAENCTEADARLIAAAKVMLAVLRRSHEADMSGNALDLAKAKVLRYFAIKQAAGEDAITAATEPDDWDVMAHRVADAGDDCR